MFRNIYYFFLLNLVLILSAPVALGCEDVFSSLGEVFISFVKRNTPNNSGYGVAWERKISEALKKTGYSVSSAKHFLNELESRLGSEETIKRIKSTSYFQTMSYKGFKERLALYESYIGKEGVTERLRSSLGGFHSGDVHKIRLVIKYVQDYLGGEKAEPVVRGMIESNFLAFSRARLSELKKVVEYVENFTGKDKVREKLKREPYSFVVIKLSQLKKLEQYMGAKN